MKKFKAKVIVKMKPSVKDVKGETVKRAIQDYLPLENLSCNAGNVYYLTFDAQNEAEALHAVEKIAADILSNEVIEAYEIRYIEEIYE